MKDEILEATDECLKITSEFWLKADTESEKQMYMKKLNEGLDRRLEIMKGEEG